MEECQITCKNNGPLKIEGTFVLKDVEGNTFDLGERKAISLCRCGASEDKPFCDGSHKQVNFDSAMKVRFECEAPANSDRVYLDDIVVSVK